MFIFLLSSSTIIILLILLFTVSFLSRSSMSKREAPNIIDDLQIIDDLRRQKPIMIQKLVEKMEQEKDEFLNQIEIEVRNYIARQRRRDCLTIVEKNADDLPNKQWSPKPHPDYIKRLWAFCRGQTFDGYELDSWLTEPLKTIVAKQFNTFYEAQVSFLTVEILQNDAMRTCLCQSIYNLNSLRYISQEVRGKVTNLILGQIGHTLLQKSSIAGGISAAKVVGVPAAGQISMKLALYVVHHFEAALAPLMAQALAIPAVQKALLLIVKKFVIAAVSAVVIKTLAAKLSIGAAAIEPFVIAPTIAGLVALDIYRFPEHLGKKVAAKIRIELDQSYTKTNQQITDDVYEKLLTALLNAGINTTVNTIVNKMANSPQFETDIKQLVGAAKPH